jgi:L-rhamnose-H+ transport protein
MGYLLSLLVTLAAGGLNGSYGAPMKWSKKWHWENIWLIFSIPALLIIPLSITMMSISDFTQALSLVPSGTIILVFLLGIGWGIGSVAFGLGLHLMGLSLGYTIMMGIISVLGSLIPLLVHDPESILTHKGLLIVFAMCMTILGVIICGSAGLERDQQKSTESTSKNTRKFMSGLAICIFSAIFSCMINLAFDFGKPLADAARPFISGQFPEFKANSIIWTIALAGGAIPNVVYCIYLMLQNNTFKLFLLPETKSYWFYGFLMAFIFMGSINLYGIAASSIGESGTTVGWLIFIVGAILAANIWGITSGEWEHASKRAIRKMITGSIILVLAVAILGLENLFKN